MADVRASKRRKTLLACENCRRHKIKCDGERPICGNCSRRRRSQDGCIWKRVDGRPEDEDGQTSTSDLFKQLEERIRQLERQKSHSSTTMTPRPADQPCPPAPPEDHANERQRSRSTGPSGAISAMEGAVTGASQNEGFMGSASAVSFMNMIRQAVDPSLSRPDAPIASVESVGPSWASPSSTTNQAPRSHVLPSRTEAERLATVYWDYVHPLYPFLYKPSFEGIVRSLWTGERQAEAQSPMMRSTKTNGMCLVNLVLALACQYYDSSEYGEERREGPRSGATYFDRARSLFRHDIADGGDQNLQVIQIMLLMAQYLNSTGNPLKSWEITGLAIRICQGMGLHRGTTASARALADPVEGEMIKRVWHGCLMVERMLCTTLGRPTMTAGSEADPTPMPTELDEDMLQSGKLDGGLGFAETEATVSLTHTPSPSIVSFFVQSARLFEIVQRILLTFYSDDNLSTTPGPIDDFTGYTSIFEIDAQLTKWESMIPTYLRLGDHSVSMDERPGVARTFRRQAVVLRIRFLLARLYLFRPVLSRTCIAVRDMQTQDPSVTTAPTQHDRSLGHRTALQCSLLCVQTAIEMIKTVNYHLTTAAAWGVKPSWLYGVLHVYIAATVLLAARLAPAVLLDEISQDDIQESWHHALNILGRFQADNVSASRCVTALMVLYRKLPGGAPPGEHPANAHDPKSPNNIAENSDSAGMPDALGSHFWEAWNDLDLEQGVDMDWIPDFNFTDPYDMTWFQVTAPGLNSSR